MKSMQKPIVLHRIDDLEIFMNFYTAMVLVLHRIDDLERYATARCRSPVVLHRIDDLEIWHRLSFGFF